MSYTKKAIKDILVAGVEEDDIRREIIACKWEFAHSISLLLSTSEK